MIPVWSQLCAFMYNPTKVSSLKMQILRNRRVSEGAWRSLVILVAIFSLTFSLATRFCVQPSPQIHSLKSLDRQSTEPKRQHLNKDASGWIAPTPQFAFLEPAVLQPHFSPVEPALTSHLSDESLYNRPPPSIL